jgi:hypothetical protein
MKESKGFENTTKNNQYDNAQNQMNKNKAHIQHWEGHDGPLISRSRKSMNQKKS